MGFEKLQLMELNEIIKLISIHKTFITRSYTYHNDFILMVSKNNKIEILYDPNNIKLKVIGE